MLISGPNKMGVASPLQSGKPIENWLDGLLTKELVALWVFLSGNPDDIDYAVFQRQKDLPTAQEVKELLYSKTMPSFFYACKDRGDLRSS